MVSIGSVVISPLLILILVICDFSFSDLSTLLIFSRNQLFALLIYSIVFASFDFIWFSSNNVFL